MAKNMTKQSPKLDFEIENHGSIFLMRPLTEAAQEWLNEHVAVEQTFGKAVVVEHRYIADIVCGARRDGLRVA